jgi:hypothetical protein
METDIFDKKWQLIESKCLIDSTKKVEQPPIALSLGNKSFPSKNGLGGTKPTWEVFEIPICTYGNFSFIQAPPKSKKTFFVSLLTAAYLGANNFSGKIKSHRDNRKLLHFDTEQGSWHSARAFKRAIDMSGIQNNYFTFALRTLGYKDRIEFIQYCIQKYQNAGMIVIDGIADLVSDVNDIEQSNNCVQQLMKWSADYKCHIVTVIHSNFGNDKPTGHLGSFLEKKCETQISLEVNTVNKDWISVSCKRSRSFPFENFSFKVNDFGLPEIIGDLYDPLK